MFLGACHEALKRKCPAPGKDRMLDGIREKPRASWPVSQSEGAVCVKKSSRLRFSGVRFQSHLHITLYPRKPLIDIGRVLQTKDLSELSGISLLSRGLPRTIASRTFDRIGCEQFSPQEPVTCASFFRLPPA